MVSYEIHIFLSNLTFEEVDDRNNSRWSRSDLVQMSNRDYSDNPIARSVHFHCRSACGAEVDAQFECTHFPKYFHVNGLQ